LGGSRVVSTALGKELKLALVEVQVQSGLAVVALPQFRPKAAFNVDGIAFLEVLGDCFRGAAEEVGFVPDWNFNAIFTGAGDFIRAD
jgi:hypothetical protein